MLRITHRIYSVVAVNVVYMVTISGLALWWVNRGLEWIAAAWLIGNAVAAVTALVSISLSSREHAPAA